MFGLFGGRERARDKAVSSITENLRLQLGGHIKFGNLVEAIQKNAYIAGYIEGKLLSFIAYFTKAEGLSSEDANMVSGMVLLNLFGESQSLDVSQAIKAHRTRGTPPYIDGINKGWEIVAYATQYKDIRHDPNYAKAIATFRAMERKQGLQSNSDDHWAAIAGLEQLQFGDYLATD